VAPQREFFRIERDGQLLGQFYLDPLARTGKRGGAWMDDARALAAPGHGTLQTPVAYLVCNFAAGVDGKPPLLTHDDVITLFHEFGHGLHHMLTQVDERDVSGISGVEWDAGAAQPVHGKLLLGMGRAAHMTAHVDTGEPLPRALFDKMAAKNFQAACRPCASRVRCSTCACTPSPAPRRTCRRCSTRCAPRSPCCPARLHRSHTFSHIFAGGYAAGYYS
jgi:oligopeptidase A